MDWALLVDLLKSFAWPVVVYLLGRQAMPMLKGVFERIKTLRAGDKVIELGDVPKPPELPPPPDQKALPPGENKPEQKQLPPPSDPQPQLAQPTNLPAADLLTFNSTAGVVLSWSRLEETMRREAIRLEVLGAEEGFINPASIITRLVQRNLISDEQAADINRLRTIRNELLHGRTVITQPAAEKYVVSVESHIRSIEAYADINQLRRIFGQLHVDYTDQEQVKRIRVGRLSATGVSADPEAAAGMARRRANTWAASTGGVIMQVTERDAALLLARGAQQGDPEARG